MATDEVMLVRQLDTDVMKYAGLVLCTEMERCIARLRETILSGALPCCLLDATMVYSPFQVFVSANRAVNNYLNNQMVTKSVFTEIIYSLSPSTNISDSLRTFGAKNDSPSVLIVFINDTGNFTDELKLLNEHLSGGKVLSCDELIKIVNMEKIKQVYETTEEELSISSCENALLTAMAIKHITA